MLIEELTPSTNHEYITSKYHNENKEAYKQNQHTPPVEFKDTSLLTNKDTPYTEIKDIITQENKDTPTPLQVSNSLGLEVEGGILTNQHTPLLTGKDTNILRVNNLYTTGIERLFTVYNINNNTRARGFNDKNDKTDFADKNNNIDQLVHTNSVEIKTYNEEKESSYADLAFGSLTKPTQSACLKFS